MKARQKKISIPIKDGTIIQLTPAQKAYADLKAAEPKRSLANIAAEAYPNANPDTVRQIVNANEQNQSIALYSNEQVTEAKATVYEVMQNSRGQKDSPAFQRLANDTANTILDRNLGKARQVTEVQSTKLSINIDLSGMAEAVDDNAIDVAK